MLKKVVKKVKDLMRVHSDNKRNEADMNIRYGTKERAGMTRRINVANKNMKAYEAEKARVKKSKEDYYHPKPVPGLLEEHNEKSDRKDAMRKRNRAIEKKHPDKYPNHYGDEEQRRTPWM